MTYKCEVCDYETDTKIDDMTHCGQEMKEVAAEAPAEEATEKDSDE